MICGPRGTPSTATPCPSCGSPAPRPASRRREHAGQPGHPHPAAERGPVGEPIHWLDLDLALLDAYGHNAGLVVLRDLSGAISEGPGFNVFAYVDGRWLTPARGILQGADPALGHRAGRPGRAAGARGQGAAADLRRAAEVLATSTAGGVMPVTLRPGGKLQAPAHAGLVDPTATRPVLGQPPRSAVFHSRPLRPGRPDPVAVAQNRLPGGGHPRGQPRARARRARGPPHLLAPLARQALPGAGHQPSPLLTGSSMPDPPNCS